MNFEESLALQEGPERTAALTASIQRLFKDEGPIPVLVGGGAFEILTGGAYTTGSLDFVGFVSDSMACTLRENGFQKLGRHWIHEEGQVFVEFPGESLGPNEAPFNYNAFGFDVVLVSVEDLLVDRLGAWDYWKSGVDGANAFELYRACRKEIDGERLERRVAEEGFENALKALRAFAAEWSSEDPDPQDLEAWANCGPQPEAP